MSMKRYISMKLAGAVLPATYVPAAVPPATATPNCDRSCLYGVLDTYLTALKARDTRKVICAAHVRNTENNVELRPGDGLWGTITALDSYEMRFADPQT